MYLPPLLEALGLVELEHNARNNRVRADRGGAMSATRERSAFRQAVEVSAEINAPPEEVWARLTDADGFPAWNSTVERIDGPIELGRRLAIRVPAAPGGPSVRRWWSSIRPAG